MMIDEPTYSRYFESLVHGDRLTCLEIAAGLVESGTPYHVLYTHLFQRSLYAIGALWEANRISVAVEHLATAVTESVMASLYPRLLAIQNPKGKRAVISCTVNEYHQIGARMAADMLESCGWDAWFLGANTPKQDLLSLLQEKQPDLLGLSVSLSDNMPKLLELMECVRSDFPRMDLLVGGQAFRWVGADAAQSVSGATYIPSLEELIQSVCPGGSE